jgi:hypothetical protein
MQRKEIELDGIVEGERNLFKSVAYSQASLLSKLDSAIANA